MPVTFSSKDETKQAGGRHQSRLLSTSFVLDAAAATDESLSYCETHDDRMATKNQNLIEELQRLLRSPVHIVRQIQRLH